MARTAGASTSPSASTGKESAGGNSRKSGRGASSFNSSPPSTVLRTLSAPALCGDMARLLDSRRSSAAKQQVVKIATTRRQSDPHPPTLSQPSLGSGVRGALADARFVMVGRNQYLGGFWRQDERADASGRERRPTRHRTCCCDAQRRLDALTNGKPFARTRHAEPDGTPFCQAEACFLLLLREVCFAAAVRPQVGRVNRHLSALRVLDHRQHGWQLRTKVACLIPGSWTRWVKA